MTMKLDSRGLGWSSEDDFYLKRRPYKSDYNIQKFIVKYDLNNMNEPLLIRVGSHTKVKKRYNIQFNVFGKNKFVKDIYNMANPGFIFTNKFAELFLEKFDVIITTSDNFIHKVLCRENKVVNFSVFPFPISQYTHKSDNEKFTSSIDRSSKNKFFTNYANSKEHYDELFNIWTS